MSAQHDLIRLCNLLVDNSLSASERQQLEGLLTSDKAARRWYRHFMTLHVSLQWDYALAAKQKPSSSIGLFTTRRSWMGYAVAGLVMIGLSLAMVWGITRPVTYQTITVVSVIDGAAEWNSGVVQQQALMPGDEIRAGSLALSGAGAQATLRFTDGTIVNLMGEVAMHIIDDGQKRLQVQYGQLRANVRPQPPNKPLLISTDTAVIQVVGTSFNVMVLADATTLEVDSGKVRIQRVADGKTIEIGTNQTTVITLDADQELMAHTQQSLLSTWHYDASKPLPPPGKGTWEAPTASSSALVHAVPYVASRKDSATKLIHYGVIVYSLDGFAKPFVALKENSQIRLQYRYGSKKGNVLKLFMSTQLPSGGFGGNYRTEYINGSNPDANGWRTAVISMTEFKSLTAGQPEPVGHQVVKLISLCFSAAADLQIRDVFISDGAPDLGGNVETGVQP